MRALIGVVCSLVLFGQPAAADVVDGEADLSQDHGLGAWIESTQRGNGGSGGSGGPAASWIEITYESVFGGRCLDGINRVATRHFRDGSPPVVVGVSCPGGIPPGPAIAGPSAQQVRDAVDLPTTQAGINPRVRGLVGLETWFWYEGPGAASVEVGLNGGTVTAEARVVGYEFAPGDGARYHSTTPGTEDAPAARHVYQQHGTYDVVVTVIWQGTFTFTAPGGVAVTGDLGTVRTSTTRPYEVVESQAVRSR